VVRAHTCAARQVRTPFMLVQQHDYVLARPFDVRNPPLLALTRT